jgi:hypothetical protein
MPRWIAIVILLVIFIASCVIGGLSKAFDMGNPAGFGYGMFCLGIIVLLVILLFYRME